MNNELWHDHIFQHLFALIVRMCDKMSMKTKLIIVIGVFNLALNLPIFNFLVFFRIVILRNWINLVNTYLFIYMLNRSFSISI